ncbi:transcriptional regulator [Sphingomonas sp. PAMC 26605]|uniref:transcriptional regulator n=1 Tax=Sphingomonas sp. PAMC 26605 TaxID=1112214 RepID=UPI000565F89E|nr:transcriptional regulator [Sphingomonas sp. PAMC 26605]
MIGINLERLELAMNDWGKDQSALARVVGCTPGAINQIFGGNVQRSKFLPDIADALGVSLRWLRGEDVPREPSAPIQPRTPLPVQFVTLQVALPSEDALARMFEGLLLSAGQAKPVDGLARTLAKRLPVGLSQLRDLLPAGPMDEAPALPAGRRPRGRARPAPLQSQRN